MRPHSRRVVVASQPGSAAGSRDVVQLIHELEPDVLGDVFGVGGLQPVPAADRPDQRSIPFHQRVPGLPLAVPGPGHKAGDHRVIAPAAGLMGEGRVRCHGFSWSWSGSNPYRVPGASAGRQRTTGSRASAATGGCGPSGPMRRVMTWWPRRPGGRPLPRCSRTASAAVTGQQTDELRLWSGWSLPLLEPGLHCRLKASSGPLGQPFARASSGQPAHLSCSGCCAAGRLRAWHRVGAAWAAGWIGLSWPWRAAAVTRADDWGVSCAGARRSPGWGDRR